jgi:hypothetical protein
MSSAHAASFMQGRWRLIVLTDFLHRIAPHHKHARDLAALIERKKDKRWHAEVAEKPLGACTDRG